LNNLQNTLQEDVNVFVWVIVSPGSAETQLRGSYILCMFFMDYSFLFPKMHNYKTGNLSRSTTDIDDSKVTGFLMVHGLS